MAKETVVLDFQIEQGDALRELEATKKSILQLKQEQKDLNQAYKDGDKTLEQYVADQVKLEATLKKQTAAYNQVQKSVTGLKSPFDKLNESIKNQAQSVTVAGVSLSAFANPATATVAVLGLLGKAYASSTIGAKDLAFASNQLSIATTILTNDFASLFSSAEDGEGFFSKMTNIIIAGINPATAAISNYAARLQEELEDIQREELKVQTTIKNRLAENSELQTLIAKEGTPITEQLRLQEQIIGNLKLNQSDLLPLKQQEFDIAQKLLAVDKENDNLKNIALKAELELGDAQKTTEKLIQNAERGLDNINDAESKRLSILEKQTEEKRKQADIESEKESAKKIGFVRDVQGASIKPGEDSNDVAARSAEHLADATANLTAQTAKLGGVKKVTNTIDKEQIQNLLILSNTLGLLANAFDQSTDAYKGIAIGKATIDTYLGANAAIAQLPFPADLFAAATIIISGLANVEKIAAAAGGGTFETRGPQLLLVGDNPGGKERVEVTPLSGRGRTRVGPNMIQMGGGGTMIADGGVTKDALSRLTNQQMSTPKITVINQWRDFVDFRDKKAIQSEWVER